MPYSSPFTTLGVEDIGHISDKNALNLAKKKLLAEIDLSNTQTILRGKREMTKDDVLKAFDTIGSINNWQYHRAIANDKVLLNFLENYKLEKDQQFMDMDIYDKDDFIEFISPYFSEAYEKTLVYALDHRQPKRLENLIYGNSFLGTDMDLEMIWTRTEQKIQDKISVIDDIADQIERGAQFPDAELLDYTSKQMIECLNKLPSGQFDWIRDNYGIALYNLSANMWNKRDYYRANDIALNASLLALSPEERNLIEERIAFFKTELSRLNSSTAEETSDASYGRYIFWAIFIFLQVFRHCD
jgi:hypothetical protein